MVHRMSRSYSLIDISHLTALAPEDRSWGHGWIRVCLAILGFAFLVPQSFAQGTVAGPAQPTAASAGSDVSITEFVSQMGQGLNLITAFGFIGGCVMVVGGFLNARRDENWKMTVIHGLGVAGSVALLKALFGLFVSTTATGGFISRF